MTTYNTYQEAKIANTECDIAEITEKAILEFGEKHVFEALVKSSEWEDGYVFVSNHDESPRIKDGYWKLCNPADYCMTVEKFLADGYRFVKDDVVFDFGDVVSIDTEFDVETYNKADKMDDRRYILRAAALENQMNIDNLATQTPEEKEALDLIDTTPHQYEMSKFSGGGETFNIGEYRKVSTSAMFKLIDFVNKHDIGEVGDSCVDLAIQALSEKHGVSQGNGWNGEGLPPVGVECEYKDGDNWYEVKVNYLSEWFIVIEALKSQSKLIDIKGTEISFDRSRFDDLKFRKPESPQQREERERLEAAYDLYEESQHAIGCIGYDDFDFFKKSDIQVKFWLAIVDKANYRKDKTHGTN